MSDFDHSKLRIKKGAFHNRPDFSRFLNARGLVNRAIEIGTHRGDFAERFMECWEGMWLDCIDPWGPVQGYEEQAKVLQRVWNTDGNRMHDMQYAAMKLRRFGARVQLVRMTSAQALSLYPSNSVDFVYVDGDHSYNAVYFDLCNWWGKIKSSGVLAGHDYLCPGEHEDFDVSKDVQPAVHRFAVEKGIPVYMVVEDEHLPYSYYFVKP